MPKHEGEPRRRRGAAHALLVALAILVAIVLVPILGLLAVNAFDRRDPASFLPPRPDAYASVRSLGDAVARLPGLRAADELLSGPGEAELRALLVAARSSPLLNSKAFRFFAALPAQVAIEGDQVLAAVDLGALGAAARILPIVGPLLASKDLSYERAGEVSRILIGRSPAFVRLAVSGRILLVSTSAGQIDAALARGAAAGSATASDAASAPNLAVRARLSGLELAAPIGSSRGTIRLIVDLGGLASRLSSSDPGAAALIGDLDFPREAVVDLDIADDRVALEASLPLGSSQEGLADILARRSGVPAALPLLPASTAYASLASAGSPSKLLPTVLRYVGESGRAAYDKAESACRSALGIGFDELLYSWAGDEFGAFGLGGFPDPVFYVRVADERGRKVAFEKLISSALVDENQATVVDGVRVPRLVLPWYVRQVLALAGASAPQPYWIEERGFLFLSSSAEALREVAKTAGSGESLPRTEAFRALVGSSGSDAAAAIYYSLDRGLPFFLRGSGAVERVLRLYRNGVLFMRTGSPGLRVSLLAARGAAASGLRELPGFPLAAGGRLTGAPLVLGSGSSSVAVFPLAGGRLVARPFAGGAGGKGAAAIEAKLDGDPELLTAPGRNGASVLWALTRQGTVYRFDSSLQHLRPFPYAVGARPSSPPVLVPGASPGDEPGLAFGAKGGGIVIVGADGSERRLALPGESALLSPPAFAPGAIAAYPKAFDGRVYLLDERGSALPGWPVPAGGIAFGSPVFIPGRAGSTLAFLTQAGELTMRDADGSLLAGFPLRLGGSFMKAPIPARDGSSLYLIDAEGLILRVSASGEVLGERREATLRGGEASLLLARPYGDGRELLFAAGSGDALYAYTAELEPVPGFPAKGAWLPCLADIDGDGAPEIVSGGLDDMIHAYSLR